MKLSKKFILMITWKNVCTEGIHFSKTKEQAFLMFKCNSKNVSTKCGMKTDNFIQSVYKDGKMGNFEKSVCTEKERL